MNKAGISASPSEHPFATLLEIIQLDQKELLIDTIWKDENPGQISVDSLSLLNHKFKFDSVSMLLHIQDNVRLEKCSLQVKDYKISPDTHVVTFMIADPSTEQQFPIHLTTQPILHAGKSTMKLIRNDSPSSILVSLTIGDGQLLYNCNVKDLLHSESPCFNTADFSVKISAHAHKRACDYIQSHINRAKIESRFLWSDEDPNQPAIRSAFVSQFCFGEAFNAFETYVIKCCEQWAQLDSNLFAPIGSIVQSSGHGKTRTMSEFAKRHVSVFMCLRGSNENGYPKRSRITGLFEQCLGDVTSAISFFVALFITVYSVISQIDTTNETTAAKEFFEYQPWTDDLNDKSNAFVKNFERCFDHVKAVKKPSNFVNLARRAIKSMIERLPNQRVFMFMDEGRFFIKQGRDSSKFDIMREAVRTLFHNCKVAVIIAATQIQVSQIVQSKPGRSYHIYEPFFEILYVNSIKAMPEESSSNQKLVREYNTFMKLDRIDYNYILNINPRHTCFLLGRPLWLSLAASGFRGIEQLALMKLINIGKGRWSSILKHERLYSALAIVCSRTTLPLTRNFQVNAELVARHLSTLYWMSPDIEEICVRYIQEPILSNAAAFLMANHDHLAQMLKEVHTSLLSVSQDHFDAIGKVVAELILLLAFDRAVIAHVRHERDQSSDATRQESDDEEEDESSNQNYYHLRPVTVEQFLKVLFGENHFIQMNLDKETKESLLYFNHFVKVLGDLSESDVHRLFKSCAGVQYKANNPRFDLVLFAMRRDSTIVPVRFQIRNVDRHIEEDAVMSMVPYSFHKSRNDDSKAVPYISILMNLGHSAPNRTIFETISVTEYIEDNETRPMPKFDGLDDKPITHYQANGFDSSVYPFIQNEELVEAITGLIHLSRVSKKSLIESFGPLVAEQVFDI